MTLKNCDITFQNLRLALTVVVILLVMLLLLVSNSVQDEVACFGIPAGDPMVCTGRGVCVESDLCSCFEGYAGSNCSDVSCGWTESAMGAPSPEVSAYVDSSDRIILSVVMSRRHMVNHSINLVERKECSEFEQHPNEGWVVSEQTQCSTRYTMNRTLQEHIQDPNVEKIFSESDVFELRTTIFSSYVDVSSSPCHITTFSTPYSVKVYLQGISLASFESNNQPIGSLRQERIRVLPSGLLELRATLNMNTFGLLSNFSFHSSTANDLSFSISASLVNQQCGGEGETPCSYSIVVVSTTSRSDYSGTHRFKADLLREETSQQVAVDLIFDLQYSSPIPPPISTLNITTQTTFYSENFENKKNLFDALEDAWVLTEIEQQISIPSRSLEIRHAYICCMKDRAQMPPYDPQNNLLGCTSESEEMEAWAHLIDDEQAIQGQFDPRLRPLPFIDNKNGFSFSLLPLIGGNRMCYIHVESFLKEKSRSSLRQNAVERVVSFSPLQVLLGNIDPKKDQDADSAASHEYPIQTLIVFQLLCLLSIISFILI